MEKIKVLMCGSKLHVKGGMVSVIKNYLSYDEWDNYEITYIPTHTENTTHSRLDKLVTLIYFLVEYIRIFVMISLEKFSIAHLHTAERGSFYRKALLVKLLKKFDIKVVMHHHAAEFDEFYDGLSLRKKQFVCDILEQVDLNIVLSNKLISMIKNKAPNANVSVLYNAVQTYEKKMYNSEARNCMFLGRLGKRKGAYDLIEAIKHIDDKLPSDVRFYFCGDGEINNILDKIEKSDIGHRIAYVGWIDSKQKKQLLNKIAVNILPSYNEGLPMAILETMAYGIPSISTDIASIPEVVIDGKTGCLIKPGDVSALEDAILKMFLDEEYRLSCSQESYDLISQNFDLKRNIEILKSIYKGL